MRGIPGCRCDELLAGFERFYSIRWFVDPAERREKTKVRKFVVFLGFSAFCCAAVCADELVVGGGAHQGTFEGLANGTVQFVTSKGRFMKEQPTRISRLTVTSSNKATYVTSEKKDPETAVFKGFEKLKFIFEKDGKEVIVHHTKMKKIDIEYESKGNGTDDGIAQIQPLDISAIEQSAKDGLLTPAQIAILDCYKAARAAYDAFLAKSTELRNKMDAATGAAREDLLNQLRTRKNEEQPIKKALLEAQSALMSAFPESGADNPPPQKSPPAKSGQGKKK